MSLLTRAELQKFQRFIEEEDYSSALLLAEKYGLDKDDVHKPQWTKSEYGEEAIQNILSKVEDQMWIVRECKERVGPSYESMTALLSYGLKVTEPYVYPESGISSLDGAGSDKRWWFRFKRLRLLQFKDRLETFIGINNNRYSRKEYRIFRSAPLLVVATRLAERGKTGALALLFSRHFYSLAPYVLELLDAIPETIPPQNYSHLLPGTSPPKSVLPRKIGDWVESSDILGALKSGKRTYEDDMELDLDECTEHVVKLKKGLQWPSINVIIDWYIRRSRNIDSSSGLLENSFSLLQFGVKKGIKELEDFSKDVADLMTIIYTSDSGGAFLSLCLSDWERLSRFDKFKLVLDGALEDDIVERLKEQAVSFVPNSSRGRSASNNNSDTDCVWTSSSFLKRWLREAATDQRFSLCATILDYCSKEHEEQCLFESRGDLAKVALECIYSCPHTEESVWRKMSSILLSLQNRSKEISLGTEEAHEHRGLRKGLMSAFRGAVTKSADFPLSMAPLVPSSDEKRPLAPRTPDLSSRNTALSEELEEQVRLAESHVKAGQLLLKYQVPRPIKFFLASREDPKKAKHLIRGLLVKFHRQDTSRNDNAWAVLWQDLRLLQENGFPFVYRETLLLEFCQGLLRAGNFHMAKKYLKGTGTVSLHVDKAEKLVLRIAREYFISSSSLESSSIAKAVDCLRILPPSQALTAELNVITAVTEVLPSLRVTLLPLQFRQLQNNMEAVKLAISCGTGASLDVQEIKHLAHLLGLTSADEQSAVEAAIARESAGAGDFQLARDLCVALVEKDYGPIWDLCAALGRGPDFDSLDLYTRKEMLGFALGYCDDESVGELLSAWKEYDMVSACQNLGSAVERPDMSVSDYEKVGASVSTFLKLDVNSVPTDETKEGSLQWQEAKLALSQVAVAMSENVEAHLKGNKKALSFLADSLPWLLKIRSSKIPSSNSDSDVPKSIHHHDVERKLSIPKETRSLSAQAAALILHGLADFDIVADDHLVLKISCEALSSPISEEDDTIGCGYLLNLRDVHLATDVLQIELTRRVDGWTTQLAMNLIVSFSSLQACALELPEPRERRKQLRKYLSKLEGCESLGAFQESLKTSSTDLKYWRDFQNSAVQTLHLSKESRELNQILPGVDAGRFIAQDQEYISECILSHVDTAKKCKDEWLPSLVAVARRYGVDTRQVLVRYFSTLLHTEVCPQDQVLTEISGYWSKLLISQDKLLSTIEVYVQAVDSTLQKLRVEDANPDQQSTDVVKQKNTLIRVLVSLSEDFTSPMKDATVNPSEMLNTLRDVVWQKLCTVEEDGQISVSTKIFVLELLEAVRNGKTPRKDIWSSSHLNDERLHISWEGWEPKSRTSAPSLMNQGEEEEKPDLAQPNNALLSLRSTQIISPFWSSIRVTSQDLASSDAAVFFFGKLVEDTSSAEHAVALKALLVEWEETFGFDHGQDEGKEQSSVDEVSGEGWEAFGENNWVVHPLHSCWKCTLQKLIDWDCSSIALSILDAALSHPTKVLVSEADTEELVAEAGKLSPSTALKLSLLLPYNHAQEVAFRLLEQELEIRGTGTDVLRNLFKQDLLAIVLSSGLISAVATDHELPRLYSSLCRSLGLLALQIQECAISSKRSLGDCLLSSEGVPFLVVAFPFLVGELTRAKQYAQAGALVLQVMRVHPTLVCWNASYVALQRYLSTQADNASLDSLVYRGKANTHFRDQCTELNHLPNTVDSLVCRLEETLRFALKTLAKDMI